MRIRFLVAIGSSEDWAFAPGEETDRFSNEQARAFIVGGIAEAVEVVPVEVATRPRKRS